MAEEITEQITDVPERPILERFPGGLRLSWRYSDLEIDAEVAHITNKAVAEVTFFYSVPGNDPTKHTLLLASSRIDFLSSTQKYNLARQLREIGFVPVDNYTLDWERKVNDLAIAVLAQCRPDEPVLELCTDDDVVPPEYIIEPLIIKNYPNVIFGDPSSSKSTVAVILSQIALLPWHDNPMGLTAPKESTKVIYLDWETDAATIQWQTIQLQHGIEGMPEMFLLYRRCSMPLAQDIDQIKAYIEDVGAQLIIIDSLGLAAGGELKDTQSALDFYSALRSLNTASLILAHNSKDRESKARSIYGNQYFTAQARNVWELRKHQEPGSNEMAIALFHRKPPPFSGLRNPLGFKLEFSNSAMIVKPSDPRTVSEFVEQMGLKAQIIEALRQGSMGVRELAELLDKPLAQVKARCYELRKHGKLTKIGEEWGLAVQDDENEH